MNPDYFSHQYPTAVPSYLEFRHNSFQNLGELVEKPLSSDITNCGELLQVKGSRTTVSLTENPQPHPYLELNASFLMITLPLLFKIF